MRRVALGLTIAAVICPFVTEIARSIIDARRRKRDGLGGTQDVALVGSLIGWGLIGSSIACWIVYFGEE
jgi:hypothetical protein